VPDPARAAPVAEPDRGNTTIRPDAASESVRRPGPGPSAAPSQRLRADRAGADSEQLSRLSLRVRLAGARAPPAPGRKSSGAAQTSYSSANHAVANPWFGHMPGKG
jgi:hypothetical protein